MKKKILTIILFAIVAAGSFILGTTQTKTEVVKPNIYDYIECDSFETFEVVNENELHIIANDGNEYIFSK